MSLGSFLLAVLCPPAYCAIHRRWPGFIVATPVWALGLWLVWLGIARWRLEGMFLAGGLLFWLFCIAVVLPYAWRWLGWLASLALIAGILVSVVTLYANVAVKARLAADQGTLAAMRSAIAIYYGQHRGYPAHPGNYVTLSPPFFQCVNLTYTYSPTTGELRITSANTWFDDCD